MRGMKGELTRNRIIEAAKKLFHLNGYSNTSMDDIVRMSKVTKGNLYYHFSSKEELGGAVVESLLTEWFSSGLNFSNQRDPVKQIVAMFKATEKGLARMNCKGGCLFGNLAVEISDIHNGLRRKLENALSRWEAQIYLVLESGREKGVLRKDLDSKAMAGFMIAVFEGGILLSKVRKDVRTFQTCTSIIQDMLESYRT